MRAPLQSATAVLGVCRVCFALLRWGVMKRSRRVHFLSGLVVAGACGFGVFPRVSCFLMIYFLVEGRNASTNLFSWALHNGNRGTTHISWYICNGNSGPKSENICCDLFSRVLCNRNRNTTLMMMIMMMMMIYNRKKDDNTHQQGINTEGGVFQGALEHDQECAYQTSSNNKGGHHPARYICNRIHISHGQTWPLSQPSDCSYIIAVCKRGGHRMEGGHVGWGAHRQGVGTGQ
jgi:hypothetical protein